ncbi:hypothetical protein QBC33DRAFT_547529 [Phialemonium atrogriseum]|uniref:Hydrophobin n=1 Tax=Phialemonium atrogriseum TaxID=1093897 RepID=A0AAJ0FKM2_9PEZI|nr:uncharacterized protein QBC33DRAFT_547529 [Phialemonium atrogriseum]KAK1764220.1 hypothetical protein QBC33DRAFT_547529 [Phialemonium atrogriseum]
MYLTAVGLLGMALGAAGLPSSLDQRQTTASTGTCILATNTCNITAPPEVAGLMVNCAAGGGLDGSIGRGQHNCTVDGHACSWHGLFSAVICD